MELESITLEAVVFAALLKLTSSADDLIWLPRYAREGRKLPAAIQYALTLLGIVFLAFSVARIGAWLIPDENTLKIISGVLLIIFAIGYLRGEHDFGGKGVIGIVFLGSLDELGIFTGMFAGRLIGLGSALIGTLLAALIVILAVEVFSRIAFVMRILSAMPVWLVIFFVGLWMCFEGIR